jgi:hypothetical protein
VTTKTTMLSGAMTTARTSSRCRVSRVDPFQSTVLKGGGEVTNEEMSKFALESVIVRPRGTRCTCNPEDPLSSPCSSCVKLNEVRDWTFNAIRENAALKARIEKLESLGPMIERLLSKPTYAEELGIRTHIAKVLRGEDQTGESPVAVAAKNVHDAQAVSEAVAEAYKVMPITGSILRSMSDERPKGFKRAAEADESAESISVGGLAYSMGFIGADPSRDVSRSVGKCQGCGAHAELSRSKGFMLCPACCDRM